MRHPSEWPKRAQFLAGFVCGAAVTLANAVRKAGLFDMAFEEFVLLTGLGGGLGIALVFFLRLQHDLRRLK